jgi:hypothetical protein
MNVQRSRKAKNILDKIAKWLHDALIETTQDAVIIISAKGE